MVRVFSYRVFACTGVGNVDLSKGCTRVCTPTRLTACEMGVCYIRTLEKSEKKMGGLSKSM